MTTRSSRCGFRVEHVQAYSGEPAGVQRVQGGVEVEQAAPAAVDEDRAGPQPAQELLVDQVAGLLGERHVQRDIDRRRLCGNGSFDLPAIIDALRSAGWRGPWGVEILSEQHRHTPLQQGVTAAYQTALAQLARKAAR